MTTLPPKHLSESLHRVASIDALRGLAALMVLFYHAREIFWVGLATTYHHYGLHPDLNACLGYLTLPFSYGSLGVTLFFVLSGYCIHRRGARMLAQDPLTKFDYQAFALRRFWRIYPTYIAALLLTAAVDAWLAHKTGLRNPGQDDSVFAFLISLLTLQGYFAPFFGSNAVFWTLAMEVHLYLAYPILFHLSKRFGPRKTLLFTLAVGLAYLAANAWFGIENHLPYRFSRGPVFLPYWFTWAIGFFVAEIEARRTEDFGRQIWRGLITVGFLVGLGLTILKQYEFADMFWALFFGGFLRWSLQPQGKQFWSGWLGAGLAFVGVFSYSLYAIHKPLLEVIHALLAPAESDKFTTIWPALAAVVFAIAGAWLFFLLVERWSIRNSGASAVRGKA